MDLSVLQVPFSNIRRPRPLMDLEPPPEKPPKEAKETTDEEVCVRSPSAL